VLGSGVTKGGARASIQNKLTLFSGHLYTHYANLIMTTVRFLCLIFILRFHSFTDKLLHAWLRSNLTQVTMNNRKKLQLT